MQATNPEKFSIEDRYRLEERVRFYQSQMDRFSLRPGKPYSKMNPSFIIFVCDFDCFGYGWAVYEKESRIKGCKAEYKDGSNVFILNADYSEPNTEPAILEFLDCIHTNDTKRKYTSQLMKSVCPAMERVRTNPERPANKSQVKKSGI